MKGKFVDNIPEDDGKTRRRIEELEKVCINAVNRQNCSEINGLTDRNVKCRECKVNRAFINLVGAPMRDFV